ncbi:MAG: hypothetical protein GY839_11700 [candidate division Zixibacteria bacterium]|nr:hypothetical protein [candidate division Zixibacteria bacterium]
MRRIETITGVLACLFALSISAQSQTVDVLIWYGNLDGSPIVVDINDTVMVDVYMQSAEEIEIEAITLVLGSNDQYISDLISEAYGEMHIMPESCQTGGFYPPYGSPPNEPDWSSQEFLWFGIWGARRVIRFEEPTMIASYAMTVVGDEEVIGSVVYCLGSGLNGTYSDTDIAGYQGGHIILSYEEYFSPFYFYTPDPQPGDINGTIINFDGDPVEDVHVRTTDMNYNDTTNVNGEFILTSLDLGIHDIILFHSYYPDTTLIGVPVSSGGTTDIEITLGGAISGTVADIDQLPIEGVTAGIIGTGISAVTNIDGEYGLNNIIWGNYDVYFSHPDYEYIIVNDVVVKSGETTIENVTLHLTPLPAFATGTVTNQYGDTLAGVYIYVQNTDNGDTTDANGKYFIDNIEPFRQRLCGVSPDTNYPAQYFDRIYFHENDTAYYNITFYRYPFIDVGTAKLLSPPAGVECDSSYEITAVVRNYGTEPQTFDVIANISYFLTPDIIYSDTITDYFLAERTSALVNFQLEYTPVTDTFYMVTVHTVLEGDENDRNNGAGSRSSCTPDIYIWAGNVDLSPINATAGQQIDIKIYFQTQDYANGFDISYPLGINNTYIDSFITNECQIHYPFSQWDAKGFGNLNDNYSTDELGNSWDSYTFTGFAECFPPYNSPFLHTESGDPPIHGLTYAVQVSNNVDTNNRIIANAIGPGGDPITGRANIGDPQGGWGYTLGQFFSPISLSNFHYTPGDANMYNGQWPPSVIGGDVTYLANYFRSAPTSQPCLLDGLWASADVNGDCLVIGSDVTRIVNYFKGNIGLSYCPDYPPAWPIPAGIPIDAPSGWPNCE